MIGSMMTIEKTPKILVSVIVPVWNPGPGISRCIESLQNQTLKEIEMIFVDDCGTDDSMDKVRAAAAEDTRIRIIVNEENIGAGPSRNRGIEAARGEYLSFVDPDDYVAPDFLELLCREALKKQLDIVKGSCIPQKQNGVLLESDKNQRIRTGLANGKSLYALFTFEHQTAIYLRETVLSKEIRYGTSTRGEDTLFLLRICSQTDSFGIVNAANYFYCERPEGAMNSMGPLQLKGHIQSITDKVDYVLDNLNDDLWVKDYMRDKFLYLLKEGWRYKKNQGMSTHLLNYTKELRSLFLRLPYHSELADRCYSLRALEEYVELLPVWTGSNAWENGGNPDEYVDLIELWTEHFLKHKKEGNVCIKDLSRLVASARQAIRDNSSCRSGEDTVQPEKSKIALENQLRLLPPVLRYRILLFCAIFDVAGRLPRVFSDNL